MAQNHNWRHELNSFCQAHRLTLQWSITQHGSQLVPTWTAAVISMSQHPDDYAVCPMLIALLVNGVEWGRGTSTTTSAAKDIAAEAAVRSLLHSRAG
ncbi:hypothetical protein C8Q70DRAFT_976148 [Cubamyces menziesii]|nr:hypothetical protein C8Q70DRAFT_976148 [Cubamyces menziesii]